MSESSHGLPGVLGEIADLVGIEAALAIAGKVGGTRAYIARRLGADHWLVQAVGAETAAVIADHFATGRSGVDLDFPVGPAGSYNRERRERARRLTQLTAQGLSNSQVARQAGITVRGVQMFNARRRGDADDPQNSFEF